MAAIPPLRMSRQVPPPPIGAAAALEQTPRLVRVDDADQGAPARFVLYRSKSTTDLCDDSWHRLPEQVGEHQLLVNNRRVTRRRQKMSPEPALDIPPTDTLQRRRDVPMLPLAGSAIVRPSPPAVPQTSRDAFSAPHDASPEFLEWLSKYRAKPAVSRGMHRSASVQAIAHARKIDPLPVLPLTIGLLPPLGSASAADAADVPLLDRTGARAGSRLGRLSAAVSAASMEDEELSTSSAAASTTAAAAASLAGDSSPALAAVAAQGAPPVAPVSAPLPGIEATAAEKKAQEDWEARLRVLSTEGLEVGLLEGVPTIIAGRLQMIVTRLAQWAVAEEASTIMPQVVALFLAFPRICTPAEMISLLSGLFHDQNLESVETSGTLVRAKHSRKLGIVILLQMWMEQNWKAEFIFANESFRRDLQTLVSQLDFVLDGLPPASHQVFKTSRDSILTHLRQNLQLWKKIRQEQKTPDSDSAASASSSWAVGDDGSQKAKALSDLPPPRPLGMFQRKLPSKIDPLEVNPKDIAEQLTFMDGLLFKNVQRQELLSQTWLKNSSGETPIKILLEKGSQVAKWVATEIVACAALSKRAEILARFIIVCERLYEVNNFNSLLNILSGINHCSVLRLARTWEKLPASTKKLCDDLTKKMAQYGSYRIYRKKIAKRILNKETLMPCLDVLTKDLMYFDENPNFIGDSKEFINFDKYGWMARYILNVEEMQRRVPVPDFAKENVNDRTLRDFLSDPRPRIEDEKKLYSLSLLAEPRQKDV